MSSNQINDLATSTVYDSAGEKVGRIETLYVDERNGLPTWVSVKTGWFGLSHSLVPLAGAVHRGDELHVAYTKEKIKNAPHLDSDEGATARQDREMLAYYGLTSATSGWSDYGRHAAPAPKRAEPDQDESSVVRSEERLRAGTERVESGRARLRKYVVTEQQTVTVPVTREEVKVVREPIDPRTHTKSTIGEDAAEVVLHEDRVRISKETVPVERVGLAVTEQEQKHTVTEEVRKERVDVDGPVDDNSETRR